MRREAEVERLPAGFGSGKLVARVWVANRGFRLIYIFFTGIFYADVVEMPKQTYTPNLPSLGSSPL